MEGFLLSTKELRESVKELRESIKELRESAKAHDTILQRHASLISDLVRIAASHDRRIERVEAGRVEVRPAPVIEELRLEELRFDSYS